MTTRRSFLKAMGAVAGMVLIPLRWKVPARKVGGAEQMMGNWTFRRGKDAAELTKYVGKVNSEGWLLRKKADEVWCGEWICVGVDAKKCGEDDLFKVTALYKPFDGDGQWYARADLNALI